MAGEASVKLIILAGMPATGKTTLAAKLQKHFGFPVFGKDAIKECLFDTIGFEDYAGKRRLDDAANAVLLEQTERMLAAGCSLIVDNNFDGASAAALARLLERYPADCVTVFLTGDPQVLYERYFDRDSHGRRHLGHAMQTHYPPHEGESTVFAMTREGFDERFLRRGMDRMTWGGARIMLDATDPSAIDAEELAARIEALPAKGDRPV